MQRFAVVTMIFAPLTLATGFFGDATFCPHLPGSFTYNYIYIHIYIYIYLLTSCKSRYRRCPLTARLRTTCDLNPHRHERAHTRPVHEFGRRRRVRISETNSENDFLVRIAHAFPARTRTFGLSWGITEIALIVSQNHNNFVVCRGMALCTILMWMLFKKMKLFE
jgi:hypothetical protein